MFNFSRLSLKKTLFAIIVSLYVSIALNVDLSARFPSNGWYIDFLDSLNNKGIYDFITFFGVLIILLFCIYDLTKAELLSNIKRPSVIIPAFLFSIFQVWGYSFDNTDSWDWVLSNGSQVFESCFVILALFILFSLIIQKLFRGIDEYDQNCNSNFCEKEKKKKNIVLRIIYKYELLILKKPFIVCFVSLLLLYLPFVILFYPGIFTGDAYAYIAEGFNKHSWTNDLMNLLNPEVRLTRWHSVTYTLFFHFCLRVGETIFNSDNIGVFLVSFSQVLFAIIVVSGIVKYLVSIKINQHFIVLIVLYFGLNYRIFELLMVDVKDVFYAFLLLAFAVYTLNKCSLSKQELSNVDCMNICVMGLLLGTLRNEAIYILFIYFLLLAVVNRANRHRFKRIAICGLVIVSLIIGYGRVLTALDITPPSKAEMLSIPFQQTARYLKEYPDDVNEDEYKTINRILDAETIKEKYVPRMSDNVKHTFKLTSGSDDLKAYFRVWMKMFFKHPGVYIQATMNNHYQYFYIGSGSCAKFTSVKWSSDCMKKANTYMSDHPLKIGYPECSILTKLRFGLEKLNRCVFNAPFISMLNKSSFYVWLVILMLCYVCRSRSKVWIPIVFLYLTIILIALAGPVGGYYFRYVYSIAIALPIVIIVFFKWLGTNNSSETN